MADRYCGMLGAALEVLDTSIVNVSLLHMQGSFGARRDEVTWILTSYIVAKGIKAAGAASGPMPPPMMTTSNGPLF